MSMQCRKCGSVAVNGKWLERVNQRGVPGVWECRPTCKTTLTPDDALVAAILGGPPTETQEPTR